MFRAVFVLVALLAGCAAGPSPQALLPVDPATAQVAGARHIRTFVVTTRGKKPEQPYFFDNSRTMVSHVSYDISVPPNHQLARVEWPDGTPDPATDFVNLGRKDYDTKAFLRALSADRGKVDVTLFIHGYNNSFESALYRATQIAVDSRSGAVPVLFAWPSVARTTGYVADRDAADFSRAALADLIIQLAESPNVGRVFLVGHSMGGRLTMEALMQLRLARRDDILSQLEVVLADPDIDTELFWEQSRIIGKLPVPLVVVVAPDDRALMISQVLAAGRERIGKVNVRSPEIVRQAHAHGVRIVDVSAMNTDAIGHNRIMQIASQYNSLPAGTGGIRNAGAYIAGAVGLGLTQISSRIIDQK